MVKYKCIYDNIETSLSECPICHKRTELIISELYWCNNCNIPVYESECPICKKECRRLASDLRPVFPEERLLIELIIGTPFSFINSSVWCGQKSRYYVDGESISFLVKNLKNIDIEKLKTEYKKCKDLNSDSGFKQYIEKFVRANKARYNELTKEAFQYIYDKSKNSGVGNMFVSFSGGKDSTVTSDIVTKALGTPEILHIFGDTTLEFPETLEYVKRFKKNNPKTPMVIAKNKEKNFFELCQAIGPPSRVMRWCCTVFKTGAINKKINTLFKNKKNITTFYGIRRSESASRNKYDRKADSPKIIKQTVISPIIDWFDFDIWLYILTTGIDFNRAYRYGYTRVGCWCCPNNGMWSEFLSKIYMSEQYKSFRELLVEFAGSIGKLDREEYIDSGNWKARQGGNGLEAAGKSVISFEPCAVEENTFNYELKRPISDEFFELFKPFGFINKTLGNPRLGEIYITDRQENIVMKLQGKKGSTALKVTVITNKIGKTKGIKAIEEKIRCQITKYQMCINCQACDSICIQDAINIIEGLNGEIKYIISDKKCIRCQECISHYPGGCYMRKILAIKR